MIKEKSDNMEKIFSNEENLLEIVTIIFEISCIEIPNFYSDEQEIIHNKEISKKFDAKKKKIIEKIIEILIICDDDEGENHVRSCSGYKFLENFREERLVN